MIKGLIELQRGKEKGFIGIGGGLIELQRGKEKGFIGIEGKEEKETKKTLNLHPFSKENLYHEKL